MGEEPMPEYRTMTLHEKLELGVKSIELKKQGKLEESERLEKSIPLAPYLAKFIKDHFGLEELLESGWNLAEAEAEYGSDWLIK
jgi:hypothetical protein